MRAKILPFGEGEPLLSVRSKLKLDMKKRYYSLAPLFLLAGLLFSSSLGAQDALRIALDHLEQERAQYGLTSEDVSAPIVSSQYASKKSGVTHLYLNQSLGGIEVRYATANANITADGRVSSMHIDFVPNLAAKVTNAMPVIDAQSAVHQLAGALGLSLPAGLKVKETLGNVAQEVLFDAGAASLEPIRAKLIYQVDKTEGVRLAWEVQWYAPSADHYWVAAIDAGNGQVLENDDHVLHCNFGDPAHADHAAHIGYSPRQGSLVFKQSETALTTVMPNTYRVFPMPVESPNHGPREYVTDPADLIASPYGWHDVDGEAGAEYTITRGNNVHAYHDIDDDNQSSDDEPDGGPTLEFDFPYSPDSMPEYFLDASVVNLFYWNNIMHDVTYQYGFDEAAGNFQENNYGNGGEQGDYVRAEAQDGGGTNNANFFTPADGSRGRMQMYLWFGASGQTDTFQVLDPANIAGAYEVALAGFGSAFPSTELIAEVVLVDDGSATPTLGCLPFVNSGDMVGKIAMVDRGDCAFGAKATNAQDAGAVATLVCNNQPTGVFEMGGNYPDVDIPSFMLGLQDCNLIKAELSAGNPVTVRLKGAGGGAARDSGFDSGIVCHEYGHGISNRLTGGPSVNNCLNNDEQMGEGWSDFFGMVLTMEEGDAGPDVRGVGTYAINETIMGEGIRPAPYSTDFAVNNFTYADTNDEENISQPHGIGFVWCSMLWDMTWALIDQYGFDTDFYNGTGGNNIAMQLVMEGMKLQPCRPGFVDGRDAILEADELLYDGAHKCLIWEAFAKRGLGYSADQGDSDDRTDQEEAFDLPPWCLPPNGPPTTTIVASSINSCSGLIYFFDNSTEYPQDWQWNFGDGNTSDEENPIHQYMESGTYQVTLQATNSLGAGTASITVVVDLVEPPVVEDALGCDGQSSLLTASGATDYNWYLDGEYLGSGNPFQSPELEGNTTFMVEAEQKGAQYNLGPVDNNFGLGGYSSSPNLQTLNFTAHAPLVLESVLVDADSARIREILLLDEEGEVLQSVSVFIPAGVSQITLNMTIDEPGNYRLGGYELGLYRNNFGALFPYTVPDLVSITGTSSSSIFYYYFYNWQVREASCFSPQVPLFVEAQESPVADFTVIQNDDQVQFSDESTGATSWFWDFGDGNTSTAQNPAHTYKVNGVYSATLTVSNGTCEDIFEVILVIINAGVDAIEGLTQLQLRPNLGSGQFQLYLEMEQPKDVRMDVFNTIGQTILSNQWDASSIIIEDIDLGLVPAGAYFVRIAVDGQAAYRKYVLVR